MTVTLKIGGARGIGGAALLEDVARFRDDLIVVHGGSDATTQLQEQLGAPAEFVTSPSGQVSRRTDRAALEAFAMATGLVNRCTVEGLLGRGRRAIGLSGLDGTLATGPRKATIRVATGDRVRVLRDEWTGRVERVDGELLGLLLDRGLTPVVAPLAASPAGEMLNVDGDRLAARVASAVQSETLVILTNVPGLLRDPADPTSLVRSVARDEFERAAALAEGRMRKKLLGAREALDAGVRRVVIADARVQAPLTAALSGAGTVLGEAWPTPVGGLA